MQPAKAEVFSYCALKSLFPRNSHPKNLSTSQSLSSNDRHETLYARKRQGVGHMHIQGMLLLDRSVHLGFNSLPPVLTLRAAAKMAKLLLFCILVKGFSKKGDFERFKVKVTVSWQSWLFAEGEFTRG